MRKITQKTAEAFLNRRPIKLGNTSVKVGHLAYQDKTSPVNESTLYLHGNEIANFNFIGRGLWFTLAGWNTPTTRERLNGLFQTFNLTCKIRQIKGEAYIQTPTELVKIDANKSYVIGGGKNTSLSIVKDFQNTEAIDTPAGWVTPEEVEQFSQKTW